MSEVQTVATGVGGAATVALAVILYLLRPTVEAWIRDRAASREEARAGWRAALAAQSAALVAQGERVEELTAQVAGLQAEVTGLRAEVVGLRAEVTSEQSITAAVTEQYEFAARRAAQLEAAWPPDRTMPPPMDPPRHSHLRRTS